MSLTSLLLAFAPALAARFEKPKPEKPPSFVCSRCGAESFNPNDIRERYCGRCHTFDELEAALEHMRVERDAERERASLWRGEALRLRHDDLLPMPIGGQHAAVQQMQQYAQNAMPQQQQMTMMNAQAYGQGLQELQQANWPHCDCSPSRSAALGLLVPGA